MKNSAHEPIIQQLSRMFIDRKLQLVLAESMTSGAVASVISTDHDAGEYFVGSVVCYSDEVKTRVLDVDDNLIEQYGGVSEQVTRALTDGLHQLFPNTSLLVSITGFAFECPATSRENPVGTTYIDIRYANHHHTEKYIFDGGDRDIIDQAVLHTFLLIQRVLEEE